MSTGYLQRLVDRAAGLARPGMLRPRLPSLFEPAGPEWAGLGAYAAESPAPPAGAAESGLSAAPAPSAAPLSSANPVDLNPPTVEAGAPASASAARAAASAGLPPVREPTPTPAPGPTSASDPPVVDRWSEPDVSSPARAPSDSPGVAVERAQDDRRRRFESPAPPGRAVAPAGPTSSGSPAAPHRSARPGPSIEPRPPAPPGAARSAPSPPAGNPPATVAAEEPVAPPESVAAHRPANPWPLAEAVPVRAAADPVDRSPVGRTPDPPAPVSHPMPALPPIVVHGGRESEPVVHITIGRIEVRAATPPPPPRAEPVAEPPEPPISLEQYLAERSRR